MKILKLTVFVIVLCTIGFCAAKPTVWQAQLSIVKIICFKNLGKAQGAKRCAPGQKRIKVNHESCKGTGYYLNYNMKCGVCSGSGRVHVEKGDYIKCYKCCGDGRKVHTTCRGKGWVWACVD